MDTTATIIIALFAVSISALVVIRLNRADDTSDELAYGDVAFIPEGMRPARNSGGGVSEQSERAVTNGSHSHDESGL